MVFVFCYSFIRQEIKKQNKKMHKSKPLFAWDCLKNRKAKLGLGSGFKTFYHLGNKIFVFLRRDGGTPNKTWS